MVSFCCAYVAAHNVHLWSSFQAQKGKEDFQVELLSKLHVSNDWVYVIFSKGWVPDGILVNISGPQLQFVIHRYVSSSSPLLLTLYSLLFSNDNWPKAKLLTSGTGSFTWTLMFLRLGHEKGHNFAALQGNVKTTGDGYHGKQHEGKRDRITSSFRFTASKVSSCYKTPNHAILFTDYLDTRRKSINTILQN